MLKIRIYQELLNKLKVIFHSSSDEQCALILGKIEHSVGDGRTLCWINNISNNKRVTYTMDPQQMMDILFNTRAISPKSNVDLVAIFHTHPTYIAEPSNIDIDKARNMGLRTVYLIMGRDRISSTNIVLRGYFWNGFEFTEIVVKCI